MKLNGTVMSVVLIRIANIQCGYCTLTLLHSGTQLARNTRVPVRNKEVLACNMWSVQN